METTKRPSKNDSPEVREWAARMVREHNALTETINGLYKVEMATLEWVDGFSQRRLWGPIGNIPPVEAELRYYQQQTELAKGA